MKRTIRIGELVWDGNNSKWGYVVSVNGRNTDGEIDDDATITVRDNNGEQWDVCSPLLYRVAVGKTFKSKPVCIEHNEDVFDYPYYSPERAENLLEIELDNQIQP